MTVELTTHYLGLKLANPIVVSSCPLVGELDVLRRLEEYGAAAAVMPSLFEEQLEHKTPDLGQIARAPGENPLLDSMAHFHGLKEYNRGPEVYLKHLAAAKKAVSIPLIGSLNVTAPGDWIRSASRIQEAGADALEVNAYFLPADLDTKGQDIEARYVELVAAVRNEISIPLAVKIAPFFTALPNVARQLVEAGADGLVLFNRFLQPDIDLDTMRVVPHLALSTSEELRLSLRWIALLSGRLPTSLAATTGAHSAADVVKLLLVGADVVMIASVLYHHGVEVLRTLIEGVRSWLENNEYHSLEQVQGILSQRKCPDSAAFERANYAQALASFSNGAPSNDAS